MRRSILGFVSILLVLAACSSQTSSATSTSAAATTGAGGAGGASACDGKKNCQTCMMCAGAVVCADLASVCQQNPSCFGIDQCFTGCGADTDCKSQCAVGNPDGVSDYTALLNCVYCQECRSDCAGFMTCTQ